MAIENLFKPIERALAMYNKKVVDGKVESQTYQETVLEQTKRRETDLFYTNNWVINIMEFHVADYIYGKSPGSPAYPDIKGSIRSGIGGRMGTGKGKIVSGKKLPTRKQNASSMPSASTVEKDKVYAAMQKIINREVKKENKVSKWREAVGKKLNIGKGKGTKQQRNRRKFGYITLHRNQATGGGIKITVHGGSADKTISAGKTNVKGRPDTILNVQQAFLQPLLKKIVKKAKKDPKIKKIMASNQEVREAFTLGHDEGLAKRGQESKLNVTRLHAGAGSKREGLNPTPGGAAVTAGQRAANDPGFGADSDTTTKMMDFLQGMEDEFDNKSPIGTNPQDAEVARIEREINERFNAAYTIEGVDKINLFGTSGKRYKGSKDIIATKDITIKMALGPTDFNLLAHKADAGGYASGQDFSLDGYFRAMREELEKTFTSADQQASLSIRELARRGVFANVAKNMKTSSGMPDMRFKVNKRIMAEAQQRFSKKKKKGKQTLQKASTKIIKKTPEKLNKVKKGAGTVGNAIGANMIRNRLGSNPLALESILEKALPKVVASKMTAPALVYRTGRFAESAAIADVMMGPRGGMHIDYTYARDPYETFEPGNRQGSTYRDPRKIIGSSVREIAQSILGNKFIRIRRT
jgi:hypothetical protein